MSRDDNPLRMWAIQIKNSLRVPEVTTDTLFKALVDHDSRNVTQYYYGYKVPKDSSERYDLDMRLHALRYIAESLVVN
jgi:hypothetical protein